MIPLRVALCGIGAWTPGFEGWPALRAALRDPAGVPALDGARRPSPALLPPAERRRVPDGVAVALEAAREAIASAAPLDTASLASVFASAHGDLAIVDYLCATLATDPLLLSPTRFHHSVHNAASGYWSIATPSMGPSTALAAGDDSFVLGLLDAMTMVVAEERPVLLVAFDTPGVGLLARVASNTTLFGTALLLVPPAVSPDAPMLTLTLASRASAPATTTQPRWHPLVASSPAARALALLEACALGRPTVDYPMDAASTITLHLEPTATPGSGTPIE